MRYHRLSTIVRGHQTELEIGWCHAVRAYWACAVIDLDDRFCADARVYFHMKNGVDSRALDSLIASLTKFGLDVPAALIRTLAEERRGTVDFPIVQSDDLDDYALRRNPWQESE